MLKHFKVDNSRNELYVDLQFYQMDLKSVVDNARKTDPEIFIEDGIYLPSWSKFSANPYKSKGFYVNMLEALFNGKGNDNSLNLDSQIGRDPKESNLVSMMFFPGSTTNENFEKISGITSQTLTNMHIIPVGGSFDITNATAETFVKNEIMIAKSTGKDCLILSVNMAQRSFSIPELSTIFLAYDNGDIGPTTQKIARALTPKDKTKKGRIISLSFDPNRDDKFDSLIIETAKNYKKNKNISDIKKALEEVLRTLDIFRCYEDGPVPILIDDYLEKAIERKSIDRIIGKLADISLLNQDEIDAILSGDIVAYKINKQSAQKGKITKASASSTKTPQNKKTEKNQIEELRKKLVQISENIDIILSCGGNKSSIKESLEMIESSNDDLKEGIQKYFQISFDLIKELINTNVLNIDLLELKYSKPLYKKQNAS